MTLNTRTKQVLIVLVIVIGTWYFTKFVNAQGNILSEVQKLTAVIKLIQTAYIEEVDLEVLTEGAIEGMLKKLDPHSVYIPPQRYEELMERDRGEFDGIGISFQIQNELITVIAPIVGTPAERLGIRSGDRIIEIDGVSAYGITNEEVVKKLRGPRGTMVKITVVREHVNEPLEFTIVRDRIPIYSVWSSFMLDDSTGYVLVNQFTATTTTELQEALTKLESEGMTRLILDLRNNQGGRLNEAISVADKFIPGGYPIVSRKGRGSIEDTTYYASGIATHPMFALTVLINSGSASASEIVAGAVQDLDRGLIVGDNSFGKGLVQYPYNLRDGGVIRLSIAHYYTPSGRLIQRSYDEGYGEYYSRRGDDEDDKDKKKHEEFKTLGGRIVYSGSGITPDYKVEEERITGGTVRLVNQQILASKTEELSHKYRDKYQNDFRKFLTEFQVDDSVIEELHALAKERDLDIPLEVLQKDKEFIKNRLKAEMAQLIWSDRNKYYQVQVSNDVVVMRAIEIFQEAREIASKWMKGSKG